MFAFVEGQPVSAADDHLVLAVGGMGFRVFVPAAKIGELAALPTVRLHIHMAVREDNITLYGFSSEEELVAFRQVLTVSGIGPKLGLALLSTWEVEELAQIIAAEDIKALTRVSGVGQKTAQRICLELKDKIKATGKPGDIGLITSAELALTGLGFRADEVRPVLRALARDSGNIEELMRRALARLGGGR